MTFNNYKNHIGKFIAENENNRFTQLETEGNYSLWKDTVTNKYYYSEPSGDEDSPRWFEADYVASMRKDAWEAWDFESEADADEFTDIIAYCDASGEIEREDGVWIEWFYLKYTHPVFAYVRCECNNPLCVQAQIARIEEFGEKYFPHTDVFGYIEHNGFEKAFDKRAYYTELCARLESAENAVLIVDTIQALSNNGILLSAELDRLTEKGVRVISADGYFDSISPSSFDVIARKRKHNLPPHAVMLHRIKMAEYKRLGKPQGFVLEDVE